MKGDIKKENSVDLLSLEALKYIDDNLCLICGSKFGSTLQHIIGKHSEVVLKLSKIPGIFGPEHEQILNPEVQIKSEFDENMKNQISIPMIKSEPFDANKSDENQSVIENKEENTRESSKKIPENVFTRDNIVKVG